MVNPDNSVKLDLSSNNVLDGGGGDDAHKTRETHAVRVKWTKLLKMLRSRHQSPVKAMESGRLFWVIKLECDGVIIPARVKYQ